MKISITGKRRLLTLIRFMESAPKSVSRRFSMGVWFMHLDGKHSHGIEPGTVVNRTILNQCGTKACALGWAATIPALRKAGLKLVATDGIGAVRYRDHDGTLESASAFFELDHHSTHNLFMSIEAESPKQWAKAARKLVAKAA